MKERIRVNIQLAFRLYIDILHMPVFIFSTETGLSPGYFSVSKNWGDGG